MNNVIHCVVPDHRSRVRTQIWRIMRLSFIFIFAALMQVSASSRAQKVTFKQNNVTLETVFKAIRKQTGYNILWSGVTVKNTKKVSVNFNNTPLDQAINISLENQGLVYEIDEKTVIITRKSPSILDKLSGPIQSLFKLIDVKGRVVDQDGKPLPNASIRVKGKSAVTNTNQNGEFELKGVDEDAVLQVSYVGFKTLEIALKDAVLPLEIKLNVQTGELEEVKVTYSTGYQNIPKERATGSFVQIDNETINRGVSTNILDRIAYLTSSLRKGKGSNIGTSDITIRGFSTIQGNAKPLIVIDGFPYQEQDNFEQISLSNLNPNDVESITVLRDAAAASIWGARSANGVIVISTKSGKINQKASISFTSNTTLSERPDLFKLNLISSSDAIDYEKKLFASGYYNDYDISFPSFNYFPTVSPAIEILLSRKRNTISQQQAEEQLVRFAGHDVRNDINKYLLRTAVTQQYNFNVSGGGDKMTYYSSIGYNKNTASEVGNGVNDLTILFKNSYRPVKKLELNTYIAYKQTKTKANGIGYQQFLADGEGTVAPYTMLADVNGNAISLPRDQREAYKDTLKTRGLLDWHYRPLDELNYQDNTTKQFNLRFGGGIKYTVLQGLDLNLGGQYNRTTTNNDNYKSLSHYETRNLINQFMFLNATGQPQYPIPLGGILDNNNRIEAAYDLRGSLNFSKTWGIHSLSALSGVDIRESQNDYNLSRKYGYDPTTLAYANNINYGTSFALRPSGTNTISENGRIGGLLIRNYSYYANASYVLLNKYVLTGSGRIDAANLFGMKANLKAKPNWSIGISWDISKEKFFTDESISSLKLRLTYGYNGNVDNNATSLPIISYGRNGQTYPLPLQRAVLLSPPNPGITWEKVRMINIALDFGLFSNKLYGSLEYYAKKANNLITAGPPVDQTSGTRSYRGNFGALKGEGIDLNLNGLIVDRGLKFRSALNLSYNTDEVTELYNVASPLLKTTLYLGGNGQIVGKPLNYLYSYRWAGLDSQTGNPMGIISDQILPFSTVMGYNSDFTSLNAKPEDLVYNGHGAPTVFGNFINDISYKGLSVSFNISYAFDYYFRRASVDFNRLQSQWSAHGDYSLRWQKVGDELITTVPSMPVVPDNRYEFYRLSEELVEKGDHIRLRDVRLSYNVNKANFRRLPFKGISISMMADNLNVLLWRANNAGIDPDFNNVVPSPRSITFGLNLNY
jgi:TonB-linked SusC/RagA family outer membrane protein